MRVGATNVYAGLSLGLLFGFGCSIMRNLDYYYGGHLSYLSLHILYNTNIKIMINKKMPIISSKVSQ